MKEASHEPSSNARGAGRKRARRAHGPRVEGGSRDARKLAMLILEVLGGQRTPTDAAAQLSLSVARYYVLENQALEGLVQACEPRRPGARPSPERRIAALEREIEQLKKECARRQSLLRLAQRTFGVPAPRPEEPKTGRKRRHRPRTRALKAAAHLREPPVAAVLPDQVPDDTTA